MPALRPARRRATAAAWRLAVRHERELRTVQVLLARLLGLVARWLRALPGTSWRFGPPRRYTYDTASTFAGSPALHPVDTAWVTDRTPVAAAGPVPREFVDSLRWRMPGTFVLELVDARLWGRDAYPLSADDVLLADQTNAFRLRPDAMPVLRRARLGTPTRVPGVSTTVCGAYTSSYHHWMFDLLPRLDIAQRSGLPFDRVIAPDALGFQRETLAAAGVTGDRLYPHTGQYLQLERLVLPSVPGTPAQSPPASCAYLRRLFAADIEGQPQHRRLYLSRADTVRRKLANEDEVLAALEPLGFEPVTLSGRSVREQARLFAQAEAVVAPHGGALTNLVFCAAGTRVVELFAPGYTPPCFWTIADQLGLAYRPLFGGDPTERGTAQWRPYDVAPRRVLEALAELGLPG